MSKLWLWSLYLTFAVHVCSLSAATLSFPAGYIPFTFIDYVTRPDANGNELVMGETTAAMLTFLQQSPDPSPKETYTGSVELAPGRYFTGVLVPTAAEKPGNFSAFGNWIIDPLTQYPFPLNYVPTSLFGDIFPFLISTAAPTPAPEPSTLLFVITGSCGLLVARPKSRGK